MSARILVLGGAGLLGRAVQAELTRRRREFDAPDHAALDLLDRTALLERLDGRRPSAVINLAGFTDVGAAERPENAAAAAALNTEIPGWLAGATAERHIPFIHVSTDYVFDGAKRAPYVEDDPVHPLQVYGATKLAGEEAVTAANPGALIVRVSTLYGPDRAHRPAYVDAIRVQASALAEKGGGELAVVEHPVSSPTYAPDVAEALVELWDRGVTGIVHTVNDGGASRLELARATVRLGGFAARVGVVTRPEPAGSLARPAYSVLGTDKLAGLIGRRLAPWADALRRYLEL